VESLDGIKRINDGSIRVQRGEVQELGHPIWAVEFMDDAIQGSLFDKRS